MSATYYSDVQALYIAYFSRPADVDGLNYWEAHATSKKVTVTVAAPEIRDARPEPFRNNRPYLKRRKGRS